MQLPFLRRLLPGRADRADAHGLPDAVRPSSTSREALTTAFEDRRALLVASTDLSHYFDAETAAGSDGRVSERVAAFDPEGLLDLFEEYPEHERGRFVACGGGPAIAVMLAARALGATTARVLKYAHSGEVSGDYGGVVGYLAAAMGRPVS